MSQEREIKKLREQLKALEIESNAIKKRKEEVDTRIATVKQRIAREKSNKKAALTETETLVEGVHMLFNSNKTTNR